LVINININYLSIEDMMIEKLVRAECAWGIWTKRNGCK
jgi:hypothetical protein